MGDNKKRKTKNGADNMAKSITEPQSEEHEKIITFLKTVKFRKKLIGGLDARSVWKKLEELNRLYDAAIRAEKIRGDAVLAEYKRVAASKINKREATIERLRGIIAKNCPDSNPECGSDYEEG